MSNNQKMEEIGLRVVRQIVREKWCSIWQDISAQNDDGVDGIIFIKKKNVDTGGTLKVQVKCGSSYKTILNKYPRHICIKLDEKYITKHRQRWLRSSVPIILIYVDPSKSEEKPDAWWVNLNSNESYSESNKNIILIDRNQTFNSHSKGDLLKMSGVKSLPYIIPTFSMKKDEIAIFNLSEPLKSQARKFYKFWSESLNERQHKLLGEITVNRIGWRHITRNGRHSERIIQSWLLLPCAKKIITETVNFNRLGKAKRIDGYNHRTNEPCFKSTDYLGLRANINFPHRDRAQVQVVLKRRQVISKRDSNVIFYRLWFYSIYEKRITF